MILTQKYYRRVYEKNNFSPKFIGQFFCDEQCSDFARGTAEATYRAELGMPKHEAYSSVLKYSLNKDEESAQILVKVESPDVKNTDGWIITKFQINVAVPECILIDINKTETEYIEAGGEEPESRD